MIELNRSTFRRLVQFKIATAIATVIVAGCEAFSPRWISFSTEFDSLVLRYFGNADELTAPTLWLLMGIYGGLVLWLVASMVGLLLFERWARFGFWASTVCMYAIAFISPGLIAVYSSALSNVVTFADCALSGAILLLAYGRDHGQIWFEDNPPAASE